MAVSASFCVLRRKAHPRENFANTAFPPQDALVCEERVLAGLLVKGHPPARMFLILVIKHGTTPDELCPVFIMITVVDEVVAVPKRLRKWRCVN